MGKVLEKLAALPAVKSITDVEGGHMVVLADGREQLCATAHAARLFIKGTSDKARASRSAAPNDGEPSRPTTLEVPEIRCAKYPGLPAEMRKPIWEHDKGFSPNSVEGADAFKRGFERKSHYRGESSAAKEFEAAWDSAKRDAERKERGEDD
jgi:hypothetical protein